MVKFKPRKIYGSWTEGYVLDVHTTSSTYIGDNEFGHPQFSTERTEIGELLFQLKYRADEEALAELTEVGASFIKKWGIEPSLMVPIPPTRTYRKLQPVAKLAEKIGAKLRIPVAQDAVRKQKQFAELKNVYDAEERRRLLEGAFVVNASRVKSHRVLLIDDLFRSGATMNAIGEELLRSGAAALFAFAFTQTRSRA